MKKLALSVAGILLSAASAHADVSFDVNLGEPAPAAVYTAPAYPVYVEPGPGYIVRRDYWPSEHYDHHRHWHNDYWAHREHEHFEHERSEHEHWHG
jgi:hypothetical protein